MTAPRPVEPVVGMEFYFEGEPDLYTVVRITAKSVVAVGHPVVARDSYGIGYWRKLQPVDVLRPVLWTVGPKDDEVEVKVRLGVLDLLLDALPRFGKVCGCRECGKCVALWPTRAAALAAGRAFGWERPVARRVVRR